MKRERKGRWKEGKGGERKVKTDSERKRERESERERERAAAPHRPHTYKSSTTALRAHPASPATAMAHLLVGAGGGDVGGAGVRE